jgi:hypothetical protein
MPTTAPLVKDRSSLVVRSSGLPATRISAMVFTGPMLCAIQVVTSTVPAFVGMVMLTTLAWKVPAGTLTDVVPSPSQPKGRGRPGCLCLAVEEPGSRERTQAPPS